jgi:hypothetical protein
VALSQEITDALDALDTAQQATDQAVQQADGAAAALKAATDDNTAQAAALNDARGKQQAALTAALNLLNSTYGVSPAQLKARKR